PTLGDAPASWGSRASPHQSPTAPHRFPPESPPFRPGCQPTGSVAFSRSTDHHPAEHGDARDEYERAYDDPDEPAGVPARPRLRRAVPPTCSGPRGRRGGPRRTPAPGGRPTLSHARRPPPPPPPTAL